MGKKWCNVLLIIWAARLNFLRVSELKFRLWGGFSDDAADWEIGKSDFWVRIDRTTAHITKSNRPGDLSHLLRSLSLSLV